MASRLQAPESRPARQLSLTRYQTRNRPMQVSIETLSKLERKMTVEVPAELVENQVRNRLQEAARTVNIKGFRKGKVPVKVIQERYGKGVRQEVLGEVMSQSYYQALGQQKVKP